MVIFDGLTKNWRYPGWRITWIVGPKRVIDAVASAGSFLDGGGSRPLQRAAERFVRADNALAECAAIHRAFGQKRTRLLEGLRAIGVRFDAEPRGTFYIWGDLSGLPESIRNGHDFFRKALEHKVIVVPGEFFDVDPGGRRTTRPSRFRHHVRFSFGPSLATMERAIERLAAMVRAA